MLFIPIVVKFSVSLDGAYLYVYNFKITYIDFNKIEKNIKKKKITIRFSDISYFKEAFKLKELDVRLGFLSADFEIMILIQTVFYIIIPSSIQYFNDKKILYSFKLSEKEVENSTINGIVSFTLHKLIMQLIKNMIRRRNEHVTSNT